MSKKPLPFDTIKARFPAEYIKDFNATDAVIRAGGTTNRASAATIGWRLLRDPVIEAELRKIVAARAERVQVDADTVLRNLLELATVDPLELYNDDGTYRALRDIPRALRRCISKVATREEYEGEGKQRKLVARVVDVKLNDQQVTANVWLGKHLRLFIEQMDLPNNSSLGKLIADAFTGGGK